MNHKKPLIGKYCMPIVYAGLVYILWEAIGICVSYILGKITGRWENSLSNTYIAMFLNEIFTFSVIYIFFRKKAPLTRQYRRNISLFPVLGILIFPFIQICDDIITILYGERVFSLLSIDGIYFFIVCFAACLSTGLLEEYVWRGVILNIFLSAWGKNAKGISLSVLISSACFGLCHYINLLAGQDFISTTQQVISAACMGVFLSALFLITSYLEVPILVHSLCNFSNFLMNELLGWNYSVWKYDDILQFGLSIGYLTVGLYLISKCEKEITDSCNRINEFH